MIPKIFPMPTKLLYVYFKISWTLIDPVEPSILKPDIATDAVSDIATNTVLNENPI